MWALAHEAPGNRNALLFWTACRFGECLRNGVVGDEEGVIASLMHCCRVNGLLGEDGEGQCMATIESAFRTVGWGEGVGEAIGAEEERDALGHDGEGSTTTKEN
jgi:hypothetical protein